MIGKEPRLLRVRATVAARTPIIGELSGRPAAIVEVIGVVEGDARSFMFCPMGQVSIAIGLTGAGKGRAGD